MALQAIHSHLKQSGNFHLLNIIPSSESMRWVTYEHENAFSPKALVIGSSGGQDIVAFLAQWGEKPPELRFRTKSTTLLMDEIMAMQLIAPFKYLAGASKSEKGRVSYFIKYYFIGAGIIPGGDPWKDYTDMVRKFQTGLCVIKERRGAEKFEKEQKRRDRPKMTQHNSRKVVAETDTEEEPNSSGGVKTRASRSAKWASPASPKLSLESDSTKLKQLLRDSNELHLLDNIPTAEEMQFLVQNDLPKTLPKKLFVGKMTNNGDDIYAYMRFTNNFHEVRFFTGEGKNLRPVAADVFAKQRVCHPFSKTFATQTVDQGDKARLTLMVKWYFIDGKIAWDCVLKETKDYPNRFRSALVYIAERMESAAAKPLKADESPSLDESDIQSTLSARPASADHIKGPQSFAVPIPQQLPTPSISTHSSEPSQGRKREAGDAELEDLERIFDEDRKLTKDINEIDDRIDIVQMQLQALQEKRAEMDGARKGVRKRLKRQSLAYAQVIDEE